MEEKGLVIVNTGNGKGKTTAALGLALRAWGDGLKVLILQFIKGTWKCGELKALQQLGPGIEIRQCGKGFTWQHQEEEDDRRCAQETINRAEAEMLSGKWDMIILDEVNYAVKADLVDEEQVLALIDNKPSQMHLVLTGRDVRESIVVKADMVTEMRLIKHHFQQGVQAQKGIEF